MRNSFRLLLSVLPLVIVSPLAGCTEDKGIDDGEGDTDTDTDTDSDTDADSDSDTDTDAGDTIAEATSVGFTKDFAWGDALYGDAIDPEGDRDVFALDCVEGGVYMISTAADFGDEEGAPDTVLRLYDQDGNELAENDDMPYRFWGTDSALFWQATYDGPYYLEVMEWTDWAGEAPQGGASYQYELWGADLTGITDAEPNDTPEEVDALTDGQYYLNFWLGKESYIYEFFGDLGEVGDADLYSLSSKDAAWWGWTLWPTTYADTDFEVAVYDADGNLLAQNSDPVFNPSGSTFYDMGVLFPGEATVPYYYEIRDAGDHVGTGTFYSGLTAGYTDAIPWEDEDNQPVGLANVFSVTESKSFPGLFYGRYAGILGDGDASDNFRIDKDDVGGFDGKYLSVYVQGASNGSLLDAKITLYSDATGTTVIDSATDAPDSAGADPALWDVAMSDVDAVYVSVEAESQGDYERSNYYIVSFDVYDEPIN